MSQAGIINVIENNPTIPIYFEAQTGFAVALFNVIRVVGSGGIVTSATGNTITIDGSAIQPNLTITGNTGGAQAPVANNWTIRTQGTNVPVAGSVAVFTMNFAITNLLIGSSGAITTGGANVGYGLGAVGATTVGGSNTGVGTSALAANTTGVSNTAIGNGAMMTFNPGGATPVQTFNTCIGNNSLNQLVNGTNNTALGGNSGFNYTSNESSNILIRNAGTLAENNTIRIGTQGAGSGQQNRAFMAGIVGTTVTGNFVNVSSSGQLGEVSSGSIGQTLTGNTGGAIAPSAGNWNIVTAGSTAVFAGSGSTLTLDFGIDNLIIGTKPAGLISPATQNTGLGLLNLTSLTTGAGNTCVGIATGFSITTAPNNTYIGAGCGQLNVQAPSNTGVGTSCLAKQVGAVSAGNNTALGSAAGGNLTSGANNIYIGANAGTANTSTESSNIYIGNNGVAAENTTMRLGTQGGSQITLTYIAGQMNGLSGRCYKITTPGAFPYTTLITDHVILVDTSTAKTINLIAAPTNTPVVIIKDSTGSASTNNITINGNGKNIDGAASTSIAIPYGSLTLVYNGTQWNII